MEDLHSISHRALIRASLAVLLIDDLTGLPIRGSNARAWIKGQKPPVKKTDGWNIFLEMPQGSYTVEAEGGTYSLTSQSIDITDKMAVLMLRLRPNRLYRVPADCIRIEGVAEPHSVITLYSSGKQSSVKLLRDCKQGDTTLALFTGGSSVTEGGLFRLTSSEGTGETVRIASKSEEENGEYSLCSPLKNSYPKIGTSLATAVQTEADESGSFFAVVRKDMSDSEITAEAVGTETLTGVFMSSDQGTLSIKLI